MPPIPSAFGRTVRTHRLALGLSQRDLARLAGLSKPALVHLEHGYIRDPRASTVVRLSQSLNISADQLLAGYLDETRKRPGGKTRAFSNVVGGTTNATHAEQLHRTTT
jgi:transcriptional regulator with XRE-family HTH domain